MSKEDTTQNALSERMRISRSRSLLYSNIRTFFNSRGYLETETPVLSTNLIPESTIDNFSTLFSNEFLGSREMYLLPSPELYMKKLIAEGFGSIYQISKCFRNAEQIGCIHSPEFSMLEYYTVNFSDFDSIALTLEFLKEISLENSPLFFKSEPLIISVRDAVLKYAGVDIEKLQKASNLRNAADEIGLIVPTSEPWADTFNRIFCTFVETSIPKDRLVIFTDYPAQINCLAEKKGLYRRRWEMYAGGIELANCYTEERNPEIVREYYKTEYAALCSERLESGKVIPDIDPSFADIFSSFPQCSGVAMGLDRLLMLELEKKDINEVLLFPFTF